MSTQLPSITDVVAYVSALLSKADERLARKGSYEAEADLADISAANSSDDLKAQLNEEFKARDAEVVDYLNQTLEGCEANLRLIESYAAQVEAQMTGWGAQDLRERCWAQARKNARAHVIRLSDNPDDVINTQRDLGLEIQQLANQGAPRGDAESYYVRVFTLVEQARAYSAKIYDQFERIHQDWVDATLEELSHQVGAHLSGAGRAAREAEEQYRTWIAAWEREWKALAGSPVPTKHANLWHAAGLEGRVSLIREAYAMYQGFGCDSALKKLDGVRVALNDSLVLYQDMGDQGDSLQAYEGQIWASLNAVSSQDHKVCLCNATGDMDHSQLMARYVKELPAVTGGRVLTGREDIARALREHVQVMDEVLQSKLVGYDSVDQFNARNKAKPIPWRLVCVSHFPGCFDERMTEDLIALIKQGPRAGIRVLVQMTNSPDAQYGRMQELVERMRKSPKTYRPHWDAGRLLGWEPMACSHLYVQLPAVSQREAASIMDATAQAIAQRANASLDPMSLLPQQHFQRVSSAHRIVLPFGINDEGNVQSLQLGDVVAQGSSSFALVVGPTGSGKSVFLHDLITSALYCYSPAELQLCLLDFKEGTEFAPYANARLPQLRYVALDSMQQFAESVLAKLVGLMRQRADAFKAASQDGVHIANIAQYRDAGHHMPRVLVVMDEFQVLFDCDRDRRCANRVAGLFGELVSKGRAFGIHFVLATQTLHRIYEGNYSIAKATIDELHVRVGLKCSEREFANLMGTDRAAECVRKAEGPRGSCVFMDDYAYGSPVAVRVAYMKPEARAQLLKRIEDAYASKDFKGAYVFRGTKDELVPAATIAQMSAEKQRVYLGKPIALGRNVGLDVAPGTQSNLLVLGEDQRVLKNVVTTVMCQVVGEGTQRPRVFLFDADAMRGGSGGIMDELVRLRANVGSGVVRSAANAFQALAVLREAYDVFERRRQALAGGSADAATSDPAFLVIHNYQQIDPLVCLMEGKSVDAYEVAAPAAPPASDDPLQAMLDELSGQLGSAPQPKAATVAPRVMLRTLLESGHLCNFHVVMTCASASVLGRLMRSDLAPFNHRVVLPAATGVHTYIETDIDLKSVGSNCALYADGQNETCLIKPFEVVAGGGEER